MAEPGQIDLRSVLGDPFEDESARLSSSLRLAADRSPAEAAKADSLHRSTGVSRGAVERNLADVEELQKRQALDLRSVLGETPYTAKFLSEPHNAAQAQDDIEPLGALEKIARALQRGRQIDYVGQLSYGQMTTPQPTPEQQAELQAAKDRLTALMPEQDAEGFVSEWVDPVAEITGMMMSGLTQQWGEMAAGASAGAAVALIAGNAGPQMLAPEEALTVPAGALAGARIGLMAGLAEHVYRVEAGLAYSEMLEVTNEAGEKIDHDVARNAALGVGVINAALEMAGLKFVSAPIKETFQQWTKQYIKDAIRDKTMRHVVTGFARRYATAWAGEVSTEVLQEIVTMEASELAKQLSDGDFEAMTQDEWNERLGEIFSKVGKGMALIALPGAGANVLHDVQQVRRSKTDAERIAAVNDAAERTSLRTTNPEAFREFVREVAADSGSEAVYIDPEAAQVFFQQSPPDTPALEAVQAQIPKALESGDFIRVPLENYATDFVGTEFQQALVRDMKIDPDALTQSEAENMDIQGRISEMAAALDEEALAESAVYNDVYGQLVGLGWDRGQADKNARLHEALYRTLSEKTGETPEALLEQYGLRVQRQVDPRLRERVRRIDQFDVLVDRLRDGDVPKDADVFGESLLDFIAKKGGIRDDGGELAAMDANAGRVGARLLARQDGIEPDMMAESLAEEGFISERDVGAVWDAIRAELSGERVYRLGTENQELMSVRDNLDQLSSAIDQAGIDLNAMSNDEVRAAIMGEPGAGAIEQPAIEQSIELRQLEKRRNVVSKIRDCLGS